MSLTILMFSVLRQQVANMVLAGLRHSKREEKLTTNTARHKVTVVLPLHCIYVY